MAKVFMVRQSRRRAPVNPKGRLDIAAYRLATEKLLPRLEEKTGIPGLTEACKPWVEALVADIFPPVNVLKPPRARRRLC